MALAKLTNCRFDQARALVQAALFKSGCELDPSEKFLSEHSADLTPSMVATFIHQQTNPDQAYRLFSLAGQHVGYTHDVDAYGAILHCLCTFKHFDLIPAVLGDMIVQKCCIPPVKLAYVLNSMCPASMFQATKTLLPKLVNLGYKPSRCSYNSVLCALVESGGISKAMQLLGDAGFYVDSIMVGLLTHALCNAGKVSEAVELVESLVVKMPGSVDTLSVHGIVGHLCQAGRPSDALKLVEYVKNFAIFPDVITYNKLMAGFCSSGKVDKAMGLLTKMSEDSISPSATTFSTLLNGLCKQLKVDEALLLFQKMDSTIVNDPVSYNILVHALCAQRRIKEAWDLTSEMGRKGVPFTVHTYTAIVSGLFGVGKEEKAFEVLQEMNQRGIKGDSRLYQMFIVSLCKKGKVDDALWLLAGMVDSGIVPDQYNFCAIISGLCHVNRVVAALELGYELMKSGCIWHVVVFNPILQVLCESGDKDEAFKVLDVLLEKGAVPSHSTYSVMIKGLCYARKFDDVRKVLAEMKKNGFEPDTKTYATLINANAHHVSGTVDLFAPLIDKNIELTTGRYISLLEGLLQTGEVEFALKIFKAKPRVLGKMGTFSFNVLIDGLCKNKKVHEAREYFLKMKDSGCAPDHITYTALMHGYSSAGDFEVLGLLYKAMQGDGCKPDQVTYAVLLTGFAQCERFDELYGILDDMKAQGCPPSKTTLEVLSRHLRYKDIKRVSKYVKEVFGIAFHVEPLETAQPIKSEEEDSLRSCTRRLGATMTRDEEGNAQHYLGLEKLAIHSSKGSADGLEGQVSRYELSNKAETTICPAVGVKKNKEEVSFLSPSRSNKGGKTKNSSEVKESVRLEKQTKWKGSLSSFKEGSSNAPKDGNRLAREHTQQVIGRCSQRNTIVNESVDRLEVDEKSHQGKRGSKFVVEGGSVQSLQTSKAVGRQRTEQRKLVKE
ncbi:hypothetical protein GOP47_0029547 [Adiantum capillus-veneris]|nr:hypothetical protein GOP47_0029547 [Adiantum capillus-veneris]